MIEKLTPPSFETVFTQAAEAFEELAQQAAQRRPLLSQGVVMYQQCDQPLALQPTVSEVEAVIEQIEALQNQAAAITHQFVDQLHLFKSDLTSLGLEPAVLAHNLNTQSITQVTFLNNFLDFIISHLERNLSPSSVKTEDFSGSFVYFFPELLQQIAGHLRSILARQDLLHGRTIDLNQWVDPTCIARTVVGARSFHEPLNFNLTALDLADTGIELSPETIAVKCRQVGKPEVVENWQSSPELVESILYYLVSNATKKLSQPKHRFTNAKNVETNAEVQITWAPVTLDKHEFIALEVFDTGEPINLDALYQQVAEALQSPNHVAHQIAQEVVGNLNENADSRQLDLITAVPPAEVLYLRGFSGQGSTGMGLSEVRFLTQSGGGAVMVNNVYGRERGVAVTVLFPKHATPEELTDLHDLAEKIKALLQSGQLNINTAQAEAA